VNEDAFRYNHRDDAGAVFDAVADRAKSVRGGKRGEYYPVGEQGRLRGRGEVEGR
jgi:hypothetical protein